MMEKYRRVGSAALGTSEERGEEPDRKHLKLRERRRAFAYKKRRGS